jgi:glycosyltransferase involved in cell wall biosynthesis
MSCSVAVVLCTFNPRRDLLAWALQSVRHQQNLPGGFEFVLIDNNSDPPVSGERVRQQLHDVPFRLIRENKQGLIHARITAIRTTSAPLILFVDDDNHLAPDYVATAVSIAGGNPDIGCFGGKALAVFESPIQQWKETLLPYLGVRDYGSEVITSRRDEWGHWEPIGAGMVCRRDVAEEFISVAESGRYAITLGRSGGNWMSGEDSLIAHAAYRLGYACSYQPCLILQHWMKAERLSFRTLARTLAGHGRSQVVLQIVKGQPVSRRAFPGVIRHLAASYYMHVRKTGLSAGTVNWCWELGYASQCRRLGL